MTESQPLINGAKKKKKSNTEGQNESSSIRFHRRLTALRKTGTFTSLWSPLSLSERDQALSHGGVGHAAFLVRDAALGEIENPAAGAFDPYDGSHGLRNVVSIVSRRVCSYRPLVRLLYTVAWSLLILTFLEPPMWCRSGQYEYAADHLDGCMAIMDAKGIAAGSDEDEVNEVEFYPNSHSMLLTERQSMIVEAVFLVVIVVFIILRIGRDGMSIRTYFRPGSSRVNRVVQFVCIAIMFFGLVLQKREILMLHPYLRLFLLLSFLPVVQQDISLLFQMLPEVLNVLAVLVIFTFFWAWFGTVMFVGTEEGKEHFSNLLESMWTLYICVTTANYPDVMMPTYNNNRWTALFFISYMVLSFFFLMNVILASVVNAHDIAKEKSKKANEEASAQNLREAFRLMDPNQTGRIDRETVMSLFLILNQDFPEFRTLSEEDTKLLFAILDKDGTNSITKEEFMDFGNVLLLEFTNTSEYTTFVELAFPSVYATPWYQSFQNVIKSSSFEFATDLLLVANAVVIAIQSYPELSGQEAQVYDPKLYDGSIDTVWEYFETAFTCLYCVEALLKIVAFGWKRYVESVRNIFDFTITILAVISTAIVYYPNQISDSRIIRMIVMARVIRLMRLLTATKRFQVLGAVSAELLPAIVSVVKLLFFLMYVFSVIGVQLYGGLISRDPENDLSWLVLGTDFSDTSYWGNNFNDMVSAMNVLFNLLVVNNWTQCEIGYEATTQGLWVRLYFLSFHILGVILVNNLVTGFIINSFIEQISLFEERESSVEDVGDGEAVLYQSEAVFDSSTVTGTTTGLKGKYVARLRRGKSGVGPDHERLRKLFTSSSSGGSGEE